MDFSDIDDNHFEESVQSDIPSAEIVAAVRHRRRRRRINMSPRERNLRRLESNERERMRMHCLNDAFQVLHNEILK